MCIQDQTINLSIPKWIESYIKDINPIKSIEEKMRFVIEASRLNIKNKTGGPFAAAIFEKDSGKLVSLGTNIVTSSNISVFHAEIVAIILAQKKLNTFNLDTDKTYELVTTTEPCAMCFGAIPWSGVKRVICGASDSDARSIGFDEGAKLDNWKESLEIRGIEVITDVLKDEAAEILKNYQSLEGHIYNASTAK